MPAVTSEAQTAMTAAPSKSGSEPSSNGSGFSYAQAAKGRVASSSPSTTVHSSQATSGTTTPAKPATQVLDGEVSTGASTNGATDDNSSLEHEAADGANASATVDTDFASTMNTAQTEHEQSSVSAKDVTQTARSRESSAAPAGRQHEAMLAPHLTEASWRSTQQAPQSELSVDAGDRKKARKSKKEKVADKEPEVEKEETKPEVFVAAPPPSVNIWQQRKEAQAAKSKGSATQAGTTTDGAQMNGASDTIIDKSSEERRKSRPSMTEHGNETDDVEQSNPGKDISNGIRTSKKISDSNGKGKDDPLSRRTAPRGSRVAERDVKAAAAQLPPPVEDAVSWPTPETSLEDEKRRTQDKLEKEDNDESALSKPRPKKEWVTIPFTPSVTFNTPMPIRGRGRGGARGGRDPTGRGGHISNGSVSGERSVATATADNHHNHDARDRDRRRDSASNHRASSLPPSASKRSHVESGTNTREPRRPLVSVTSEKTKAEGFSSSNTVNTVPEETFPVDARDHSVVSQADSSTANTTNPSQSTAAWSSRSTEGQEPTNLHTSDATLVDRPAHERRSEPSVRVPDSIRDNSGHGLSRDRGEGRQDRGGRGGYRNGRGGNHNSFVNGHQQGHSAYANGHLSQPTNGYVPRQSNGPYSPPLHQTSYSTYNHGSSRSGRSLSSRSQSIPSNGGAPYQRFTPGASTSIPPMPPLQTNGMYDYPGHAMGPMSAMPYNPYIEQYSVLAMVKMQLEYYFSVNNLCKDVFLRKHMDSQGFVFLTIIAGFKRIQSLTQDIDLLRYACQESEEIEIVTGEDGIDRLRAAEGWDMWVVPIEDRDELARNAGPERFVVQQSYQRMPSRMLPHGIQPMHPGFSPSGGESGFSPYAANMPMPSVAPSIVHRSESNHMNGSPLSAAVAEFAPAPSVPSVDISDYADIETTFTDAEVDALRLVYTTPNESIEPTSRAHFQYASSRTFSNGSIDGQSLSQRFEEPGSRQGRPSTNGHVIENSLESAVHLSSSPRSPAEPKGRAPPVMWVKGQKEQAPVSDGDKSELYSVVRARALGQRQSGMTASEDMALLYDFWPHFLVRNFNPAMYEDFRRTSIEDVTQNGTMTGIKSLVAFYDEVLNSKRRVISQSLACHFVELATNEDAAGDRPAFTKLRTAWRNGALDLKSRKRIDTLIGSRLRDELER